MNALMMKSFWYTFMNENMGAFFLLNFLFCIGVYLINYVIVLGEQRRDSARELIHIHVSILPQTPFPSRLPQNVEQSSLCYKVSRSLLVICFKYSRVYVPIPDSLTIPPPPTTGNHKFRECGRFFSPNINI